MKIKIVDVMLAVGMTMAMAGSYMVVACNMTSWLCLSGVALVGAAMTLWWAQQVLIIIDRGSL